MSKPHTVTIQRTNPLGETLAVEVEIDSRADIKQEWATKVQPFFEMVDHRLHELNMRVLSVTMRTQQMRPDEADRVRQILLLVTGFAPPDVTAIKDKIAETGNMRAKQWVDDVSPDKQDDVDMTHDVERTLEVVR